MELPLLLSLIGVLVVNLVVNFALMSQGRRQRAITDRALRVAKEWEDIAMRSEQTAKDWRALYYGMCDTDTKRANVVNVAHLSDISPRQERP